MDHHHFPAVLFGSFLRGTNWRVNCKEERNINNRVGGGGGTPHGTSRGDIEIILKARLLGLQAVLIWVSFWRALKFQPFNWKVGSNSRRRSKNIEMKYKLILNLCVKLVHVSNTMWRIKNEPSNSAYCIDNALRFVSSYGRHIILRTSSDVFIFYLGLSFGR